MPQKPKLPEGKRKKPKTFKLSPGTVERLRRMAEWAGAYETTVLEDAVAQAYELECLRRGVPADGLDD